MNIEKKVSEIRRRKEKRKAMRRFDEEGHWITTENGHHIHFNDEGVPDMGNPHVLAMMNGKSGNKEGASQSKTSGKTRSTPSQERPQKSSEERVEPKSFLDIHKEYSNVSMTKMRGQYLNDSKEYEKALKPHRVIIDGAFFGYTDEGERIIKEVNDFVDGKIEEPTEAVKKVFGDDITQEKFQEKAQEHMAEYYKKQNLKIQDILVHPGKYKSYENYMDKSQASFEKTVNTNVAQKNADTDVLIGPKEFRGLQAKSATGMSPEELTAINNGFLGGGQILSKEGYLGYTKAKLKGEDIGWLGRKMEEVVSDHAVPIPDGKQLYRKSTLSELEALIGRPVDEYIKLQDTLTPAQRQGTIPKIISVGTVPQANLFNKLQGETHDPYVLFRYNSKGGKAFFTTNFTEMEAILPVGTKASNIRVSKQKTSPVMTCVKHMGGEVSICGCLWFAKQTFVRTSAFPKGEDVYVVDIDLESNDGKKGKRGR